MKSLYEAILGNNNAGLIRITDALTYQVKDKIENGEYTEHDIAQIIR